MTITDWNLREEILAVSHRWWLPTLAFLLGSLIGVGISFLIPTHYRAEKVLSVAYNADAYFTNPDDYKNWQLEQLNDLAFSTDVLRETLIRLEEIDPSWEQVSLKEFRSMLDLLWRNTGAWRFAVDSSASARASQAVETWVEVFSDHYQKAVKSAVELYANSARLSQIDRTVIDASVQLAKLSGIQNSMQVWQAEAANLPPDQQLDPVTRWQRYALAAEVAGFNPAWQQILSNFPGQDAIVADYIEWSNVLLDSINLEIQSLNNQIAILNPQRAEAVKEYEELTVRSRGLSATTIVTGAADAAAQVRAVRSTTLFALIGGFLGLLLWLLLWFVRRRPGFSQSSP